MLSTRVENHSAQKTHFHSVDLKESTFEDVNLVCASFQNVSFQGTTLRDIDFSDVNVEDANIEGLRINGHDIAQLIQGAEAQQERGLRP